MSDKESGIFDKISKSKTVQATLIAIVAVTFGFLIWTNIVIGRMMGEYVRQGSILQQLVQNQADINKFKKCIKEAHDDTTEEYNRMLQILGKTLQVNNVNFPNDLNVAIQAFRKKYDYIKDCLIFPENN